MTLAKLLALLLATGSVACATPTPQSLLDADLRVGELEQDAEVVRYAPVQIREARQALDRANADWSGESDTAEAAHLVYLVNRRVEIARSAAEGAKALEAAEAFTRQRDKVRLEARTSEADIARSAAERRAREAEAARGEAEAARGQAETARAEAEAAALRERNLREELAELQARETERGLMMTLGDVLFDLDKATLKPGAETRLDRLASFLMDYPERSLLIEGHTDSTGSDAYNLTLSQRRADAVADYLESQGIPRSRLYARGYGKAYPLVGNEKAAGRQQNRRVELVILRPGDDPESKLRPLPPS